jgi:hypothetical protein
MTRPCRWPDGGCGAEIIDVLTIKGRKQVLDATPTKGIVLTDGGMFVGLKTEDYTGGQARAEVMNVYVDHHSTCSAWAAKVERERAAKAAGS